MNRLRNWNNLETKRKSIIGFQDQKPEIKFNDLRNTKLQIPNDKQITIAKLQNPNGMFEICNLGFVWDLVLGICNFPAK
jgi:hypothetical protein